MKIGCVKEIKNNEFRVGLTPDNVRSYVAAGHHVYMEKEPALVQVSPITSMLMPAQVLSITPSTSGIWLI